MKMDNDFWFTFLYIFYIFILAYISYTWFHSVQNKEAVA